MRARFAPAVALVALACSVPNDDERRDAATDGEVRAELCAPSSPGASPVDDDLDGRVDEYCALSMGQPSAPLALHAEGSVVGPFLSDDKERLYALQTVSGRIVMMERDGRSGELGAPEEILVSPGASGFALSRDELELFVTPASGALQRFVRSGRRGAFGEPEPVALSLSPPHYHPALSPDGLELYVVSEASGALQIYRARREIVGGPFLPAELLALGGSGEVTPSLDASGLRLVFSRAGFLHYAERPALDAPWGAALPIAGPPDLLSAVYPFVAIGSREIFYVSTARSWDPVPGASLVRAELCFDGSGCAPRPIACVGGTLSPDGAHCYVAIATPLTHELATRDCTARGAHLATLHSDGERALVASLLAQELWLGAMDGDEAGCSDPASETCGFAWSTGEPWTQRAWRDGEPSGVDAEGMREACLSLGADVVLVDRACEVELPYVCETERWPVW